MMIDQSLKFESKAINNQNEYEAIIAIMVLTLDIRASNLKNKSDSQLMENQFVKDFYMKEP